MHTHLDQIFRRMMLQTSRLTLPCLLALATILHLPARGQGTAFTYQGRLNDGGAAANGKYDLRFNLYDALAAGTLVAGPKTNLAVSVSNGLFTVSVDFGAGVFSGPPRFLEIAARSNTVLTAFTALSPRQELTPTPYAIMATTSSNLLGTLPTVQLSGTVGNAQLAADAVTSAKISDGTIVNADLANDAVNSAKVLDGSLTGSDLANNTVTSAQLADTIDLGSTSASGQLNVYRTTTNTPAISLFGSSSQISTFGSDGLEQIRLWGVSYGELLFFDNTTNNNLAVSLTAGGTNPNLQLNQGNSISSGARLYGDYVQLGGRLFLYGTNTSLNFEARGQYDGATTAGWASVKDGGFERVNLAARNGTSGRGGLVDVKNDSTLNTIRLIGDSGSGDSKLEMYAGGTNLSFEVRADDSTSGSAVYLNNGTGNVRMEIDSDDGDNGAVIRMYKSNNAIGLFLDAENSNAGYLAVYGTNGTAVIQLDGKDVNGNGRVVTQVLEITGGSDLSEQFNIGGADHELQAGMVVCIDPAHPGELKPSTKAYDRTVAGVISGAGGVQPGMLMGQHGSKADGKLPVALTGRVYVKADATNGAIQPGDLLTTSAVPGHAMKVTDYASAQGAILGKAMTSLAGGKGMVMVLVTLQ